MESYDRLLVRHHAHDVLLVHSKRMARRVARSIRLLDIPAVVPKGRCWTSSLGFSTTQCKASEQGSTAQNMEPASAFVWGPW